MRIPFDELGGECVFASEWNDSNIKLYKAKYNQTPEKDITKVSENKIPSFDILLGYLPFKNFNGDQFKATNRLENMHYRSIDRIIYHSKPKYFILETAKNYINLRSYFENYLKNCKYNIYFQNFNEYLGVEKDNQPGYILGVRSDLNMKFQYLDSININLTDKDAVLKEIANQILVNNFE